MNTLYLIFGEGHDLTFWQMGSRAVVIFLVALILIRIAGRRTFGLHAPLDNIITLLLGSILADPIVGESNFGPTIFAAFIIVVLHRFIARVSVHAPVLGQLAKGKQTTLYRNGKFITNNLRYCGVSKEDIFEGIRVKAMRDSLDNIELIYMEKTGEMSFVEKAN